MKNKLLAITRGIIPYVPELRPFAGSVTATILWQQLDYWFTKYPEGFYKFLEPCENSLYKKGQAWTEELGFSSKEFRNAFKIIGFAHKSKTTFDSSPNPFLINNKEVFFISVRNNNNGLTFYYRNHNLVDSVLNSIVHADNLRTLPKVICGDDQRASAQITKGHLHINNIDHTETTTEKTTTTGTTPEKIPAKTSSSLDFDKWPCSQYHKKCFNRLFNDLNDASLAQSIIDYVMERHGKGKVNNFSGYVKTIIDKANSGDFGPLETTEPEEIITNPAKCKYCDSKGKLVFVRQDGSLTEHIDCKHGNQAYQYIQSIKTEYGYELQQG